MNRSQPPWHRTKIVCTLGPATDAPGVLEALIGAGMDVARINASHGTRTDHARRIHEVRRVARQLGQPVAVLIDLPGPKFRLGELPGGARELRPGDMVQLTARPGTADSLPVRHRQLLRALRVGEHVYLADGVVRLLVRERSADTARCEVLTGGTVRTGSGINLPESQLAGAVPTAADRGHIRFALSVRAEWLGVSFVQSAADLYRVRRLLPRTNGPRVLAKIEKPQALRELEAIVAAADGIMVARGDLGVETELAEIPFLQKRIIAAANAQARPVITATQMLESMVNHERPTRAEVTDIANAVLDGTDAVMLSAETAVGRFPAAAVEILQRVLTATEAEYGLRLAQDRLRALVATATENPLAEIACQLAMRLPAKAILVAGNHGATAQAIARYRPHAPIVVLTHTTRQGEPLAVVWGVAPVAVPRRASRQTQLAQAAHWLFARGLARPGDLAVLVSASSASTGQPDSLQIVHLAEDHRLRQA